MPAYKLVYFDGKGRAELSRLIFEYNKKKYTDERVTQEDWQARKTSTQFGQLPTLEIDGECFAQSHAIARYLAREFKMAGKTNLEELRIDQIVELTGDVFPKMAKASFEKDDDLKNKLVTEMKEVEVPKFLDYFEKAIVGNNKKNKDANKCVGSSFTLADFAVFNILDMLAKHFPCPMEKFPHVQKLQNSIKTEPTIAKYLKSRKETPF